MGRFTTVVAAAAMAALFSVMFWSQVGAVATAVARPKASAYAVTSAPYLPLHRLDPVY